MGLKIAANYQRSQGVFKHPGIPVPGSKEVTIQCLGMKVDPRMHKIKGQFSSKDVPLLLESLTISTPRSQMLTTPKFIGGLTSLPP